MRGRFSIAPSYSAPVFGLRQPSGAFAPVSENSRARFLRRARRAEPITAEDCRAPRHYRGRVRRPRVVVRVRDRQNIQTLQELGRSRRKEALISVSDISEHLYVG